MFHQQPGASALAPSSARHMRRLQAAEFARHSTPARRRASRGQTLLIFALTFTALIGFLGLAIDTARIYDLYARLQRAAEAGALAGVIYMPTNYTSDLPSAPGDNAVCRAQQEVYKNWFGGTGTPCTSAANMSANYCPLANPASVEVAVCKTSQPYQLQVFVTEPISVLFLGALGVGPLTITASATAAYNPPVDLAVDPTNPGGSGALGTIPFCNGVNCNGRPWGLNINGPAELQEQGDPFVTCQEGNSQSQVQDSSALTYTTYTGWQTNHPIYSQSLGDPPNTCNAAFASPVASQSAYLTANPDSAMQPFTGEIYSTPSNNGPTHDGYSYFVATGNQAANAWVYNAPFAPQSPSSCNGRQWTIDSFFPCPYGTYTTYPGTGDNPPNFDDPKMYFTTTYSVYLLNNGPNDPTNVTLKGAFTALPYDTGYPGKCATELLPSAAYNVATASCVTSQCVATWCPIGNQTGDTTVPTAITLQPNSFYRITVVSASYTDQGFDLGWGQHGYGLEICPTGANSQPCNSAAAGQISSWSTMDAIFLFPGKGQGQAQHTSVPLGVFGSDLAGRTIDIGLFDPGDTFGVNGTLDAVTGFALVPTINNASDPCLETPQTLTAAGYDPTPNGATFSFPAWENATTMDTIASAPAYAGFQTSNTPLLGNNRAYNGLWAHELLTLPSNYTDTAWNICDWGPGVDRDIVGISATVLGQSPVHLIQ